MTKKVYIIIRKEDKKVVFGGKNGQLHVFMTEKQALRKLSQYTDLIPNDFKVMQASVTWRKEGD